jgi:hypothetical protein
VKSPTTPFGNQWHPAGCGFGEGSCNLAQLAGIIKSPQVDVYFFVQHYVQGVAHSPFQFAIFYDMLYYSS